MLPAWQSNRIFGLGDTVSEVDKSNEDSVNRVWEVYRMFLDTAHNLK